MLDDERSEDCPATSFQALGLSTAPPGPKGKLEYCGRFIETDMCHATPPPPEWHSKSPSPQALQPMGSFLHEGAPLGTIRSDSTWRFMGSHISGVLTLLRVLMALLITTQKPRMSLPGNWQGMSLAVQEHRPAAQPCSVLPSVEGFLGFS